MPTILAISLVVLLLSARQAMKQKRRQHRTWGGWPGIVAAVAAILVVLSSIAVIRGHSGGRGQHQQTQERGASSAEKQHARDLERIGEEKAAGEWPAAEYKRELHAKQAHQQARERKVKEAR